MSVTLLTGDCREVLATLEAESVHACVTDPPYDLTSARPGGRSEATRGKVMRGFMGLAWDGTGVAFDPDTWRAVLRVLKPGAHLLAFGGTRTYHRLACAVEDAGFEIRDQIGWAFGSGFPKSHNLCGEWDGWGTALKPAWEPIVVARKPFLGTVAANVKKHGCGALNINGCRVGERERKRTTSPKGTGHAHNAYGAPSGGGNPLPLGRWPANLTHDGSDEVLACFPDAPGQIADASDSAESRKTQNVYGAMRRGDEPSANSENVGAVGFRMRPGARRGDAGSAARFFYSAKASKADRNNGTEGLLTWESVDQSRLTTLLSELRRVTFDASTWAQDECAWNTSWCGRPPTAQCLQVVRFIIEMASRTTTGLTTSNLSQRSNTSAIILGAMRMANEAGSSLADLAAFASPLQPSSTSAVTESRRAVVHALLQELSRISKSGRRGNVHSTVKPTDLMRWLCRLITPPGGLILDPFMGSGSTLKAAELEGFSAIGIELNPEYVEIARRRIAADTPLFAEVV